MTAKLLESKTIIKDGMDSLSVSNEQLQQMLENHQTDINTALTTYIGNVQAQLTQDLTQLEESTETLITNYAQHIEQLIGDREDRIAQVIKSEMKTWAIVGGIVAITILILGIILGALIFNKFSKPNYIIQQQQPINYGQQR